MTWAFALSLLLASTASAQHQIVCSGEAAGGYAAFPDVCRLRSGDLFCVCYSGYDHVSTPSAGWPKGGRIMAVRSPDNGQSRGKPVVVMDTDQDDGKTWQGPVGIDPVGGACPSMVELPDGLVYCAYDEEGKGASIRGARLRVDPKG
jgi:hypothetical protein